MCLLAASVLVSKQAFGLKYLRGKSSAIKLRPCCIKTDGSFGLWCKTTNKMFTLQVICVNIYLTHLLIKNNLITTLHLKVSLMCSVVCQIF